MKGVKGLQKGHKASGSTREKIGDALRKQIYGLCDYYHKPISDKPSHWHRHKNHFCSRKCQGRFRAECISPECQPRFGSGFAKEERLKRAKARATFNHYKRNNNLHTQPCEICGELKAEAHHDDCDKPLEVR